MILSLIVGMTGGISVKNVRAEAVSLVTFQTEIMHGDTRVKFCFDKPLSAYGVDVGSITWWGYSDDPAGIVGIGSWTDEYVELTGNALGTLTLNWKWYDRTTYQYGDYALKITVTVKEKQTVTPVPAATVPTITPASIVMPTPTATLKPAVTPMSAVAPTPPVAPTPTPPAALTPMPVAMTMPETAVTAIPVATAFPATSQAKTRSRASR